MLKSKRLWASALSIAIFLGAYLAPITAFAQDNTTAEVVAADPPASAPAPAAPTPAPEPAVESGSAEPAPPPAAPSSAPESAAAPSALSNLSTELMNILIPTFVALMGAIATFLLNWVRRKFKLNVSNDQIAQWSAIAEKAANRGGEWARNKAKGLAEGKTIPGPEVLEVAANWAIEMGKHFKLPEMGREKLIGLIESHLHANRLDPNHPLPLDLPKATVVSEG